MKIAYKKFPNIKKRTLINFVDWYENHIKAGEILPPQEDWLRLKFYEEKNNHK